MSRGCCRQAKPILHVSQWPYLYALFWSHIQYLKSRHGSFPPFSPSAFDCSNSIFLPVVPRHLPTFGKSLMIKIILLRVEFTKELYLESSFFFITQRCLRRWLPCNGFLWEKNNEHSRLLPYVMIDPQSTLFISITSVLQSVPSKPTSGSVPPVCVVRSLEETSFALCQFVGEVGPTSSTAHDAKCYSLGLWTWHLVNWKPCRIVPTIVNKWQLRLPALLLCLFKATWRYYFC